MQCILHDKLQIAKVVDVTAISLDDAAAGYRGFDRGAAKKFFIDPHGLIVDGLHRPTAARSRAFARRAHEDPTTRDL
jgi:hypothetical protein